MCERYIPKDRLEKRVITFVARFEKRMVAEKNLDMIIFLRDPLTAQPHEPDVTALLRLSDVMNIPLATNVSSATIMLEDLKLKK